MWQFSGGFLLQPNLPQLESWVGLGAGFHPVSHFEAQGFPGLEAILLAWAQMRASLPSCSLESQCKCHLMCYYIDWFNTNSSLCAKQNADAQAQRLRFSHKSLAKPGLCAETLYGRVDLAIKLRPCKQILKLGQWSAGKGWRGLARWGQDSPQICPY